MIPSIPGYGYSGKPSKPGWGPRRIASAWIELMKRLIPQFGEACLQSRGDAFTTLARSIVGQQISVKAAQTVWDRFARLPRKMSAGNVLKHIEAFLQFVTECHK